MTRFSCPRFLAGVALTLAAAAPQAATFPDRPVTLVVPYAPGGSTDNLARSLAQHMGQAMGQPVVVENKPGGNTMIGASHVARAPADGYTLFMGSIASMVLNPMLYRQLSYDPDAQLRTVAILAEVPLVLVVNPSLPVNSVAELVAYDKANPGKLNFASVGKGNPIHLAAEMLKTRAQMTAQHVPYNGSAPALTGLMGNDVQFMMDVVSTSLPLIQGGKLKALAVASAERLPALPDVPTLAESGYPGYQAATWFGLVVPAGTPPDVSARLRDAAHEALANRAFQDTFNAQGLFVQKPMGAERIPAYVEADKARWGAIIRDNGIRLD